VSGTSTLKQLERNPPIIKKKGIKDSKKLNSPFL